MIRIGGELDWKYKTTNESDACLRTNGRCAWPRGKNLGGTTLHHGMAYHRGHPKDYEKWEKLGAEGWGWKDVRSFIDICSAIRWIVRKSCSTFVICPLQVLPYYLKSENNTEIGRVSAKHHATGGPMTVQRFVDPKYLHLYRILKIISFDRRFELISECRQVPVSTSLRLAYPQSSGRSRFRRFRRFCRRKNDRFQYSSNYQWRRCETEQR